MEQIYPKSNNQGSIGKMNGTTIVKSWLYGAFKYLALNGVLYTPPSADGTNGQVLKTNGSKVLSWTAAGGATAWDDIGDPDAAGTIAFAGFQQIITSTLNLAGAVLTLTNTTADVTADVSFIDFKYTDDGDANGFFMRGYDNAGGDLKWSIGADGAVVFGAATLDSAAITAGLTVGTTCAVTGLISGAAGASLGTATNSTLRTDAIAISNAELKAIRATPKVLVAAPGAQEVIEFVSATIIMDYGSNVLSETADDLQIEYTGGLDCAAAIDTTGFLDQAGDMIMICKATTIAGSATASLKGLGIHLKNIGDGEFDGNAGNDTVLRVKITYILHTTGL